MWPGSSPGPHGLSTLDAAPLHATHNFGTVTNGLYAYGGASTFPTGSFSATNYWVDVMFAPTPAPGRRHRTSPRPRPAPRPRPSRGPRRPPAGRPRSYKITPYVGTTAKTPTTVSAPADHDDRHRPHERHHLPLHRAGDQPRRQRARSPRSPTPSRRSTPWRPTAPRNVDRASGHRRGAGRVDRAGRRRRQPDHGLHRHAVHRRRRADPRPGGRGRHEREGQRPHQRHGLHVPRDRDQRDRHRPGLLAVERGEPGEHAVRARHADASSTARTPARSSWASSSSPTPPARSPASASTRPRPTSARTPAACGPPPARASRRSRSPTRARAAGRRRRSRRRSRSPPARRTSPRTSLPPGTTRSRPGGLAQAFDNPPLHALAGNHGRQRRLPVQLERRLPDEQLQLRQLRRRRRCSPCPSPARSATSRPSRRARPRPTSRGSAPTTGGTPSSYTITPYEGTTALAPTTVAAPADKKKIGGLTTGHSYRFTVQAVNGSGGGPVSGAVELRDADRPDRARRAHRVAARPITKAAQVSWTAPTDDGDSPITGYTVTPYIGATAQDSGRRGRHGDHARRSPA